MQKVSSRSDRTDQSGGDNMTKEQREELITQVVNDMCDDKCRYPDSCSNDELDEICDNCPLNELWAFVKER